MLGLCGLLVGPIGLIVGGSCLLCSSALPGVWSFLRVTPQTPPTSAGTCAEAREEEVRWRIPCRLLSSFDLNNTQGQGRCQASQLVRKGRWGPPEGPLGPSERTAGALLTVVPDRHPGWPHYTRQRHVCCICVALPGGWRAPLPSASAVHELLLCSEAVRV